MTVSDRDADRVLKTRHRAMWASGDYPSVHTEVIHELGPRLVQAAKVGRIGGLALGYFILMSTIALAIGLVVGNILNPGDGLQLSDELRGQGAALTAWELSHHGVPHAVIADNAGGHLMQRGQVDLCIVGTDRTTRTGDVANKIGTYLKALAAKDNAVPFHVALPGSTIDWSLNDGRDIPIEERDPRELTHATGRTDAGEVTTVQVSAPGSPAANPAFDVTPARLVTALITERGVCPASEEGLLSLYPERRKPPQLSAAPPTAPPLRRGADEHESVSSPVPKRTGEGDHEVVEGARAQRLPSE